ncbi:quinone oxidoreductase [Pendulispora rubella]|uniref:Quinone oxidoreductase n=1 Tax=Pendulispora rubella TaxID=2741070 RepID=A0ABZ2L3W0_9BACT
MKAIRYHQIGDPTVLRWEDAETPVAGPGEVLIAVRAAGVNFADTERRRGLYDAAAPLPRILGSEAAGVVHAVGPGVDAAWVGRRVVALTPASYAEFTKANLDVVSALPDNVSFETAASIPVQGLTAYHLVHTAGRVTKGQWVLVHSAAGGVGLLATQLVKALGGKVVGTVSTEAKAGQALEAGADAVLRYDQVGSEVPRITEGRGVDLVLDAVGADTWRASLDSLAPFGHLILYGSASGDVPKLNVDAELMPRSLKVSAYWLRSPHPKELQQRAMASLLDEVAAGRLRITIGLQLPVTEAVEAHRRLESRATVGKVVLTV